MTDAHVTWPYDLPSGATTMGMNAASASTAGSVAQFVTASPRVGPGPETHYHEFVGDSRAIPYVTSYRLVPSIPYAVAPSDSGGVLTSGPELAMLLILLVVFVRLNWPVRLLAPLWPKKPMMGRGGIP